MKSSTKQEHGLGFSSSELQKTQLKWVEVQAIYLKWTGMGLIRYLSGRKGW